MKTTAFKTVVAILVGNVHGVHQAIAVGYNYHHEPCKRVGMPEGTPYDVCEGCEYDNHAEVNMIKDAIKRYGKARMREIGKDCVVHIIGHQYACTRCQHALEEYGITQYRFITKSNV